MPDDTPQPDEVTQPQPGQAPMPVFEEKRFVNAGIVCPPRPADAPEAELSFVVGPTKMITFVLGADAAKFVAERLAGSGIKIVGADALPPNPPDAP